MATLSWRSLENVLEKGGNTGNLDSCNILSFCIELIY